MVMVKNCRKIVWKIARGDNLKGAVWFVSHIMKGMAALRVLRTFRELLK